ncbi:hypothetical protein C4J81_09485 [Deltaproteobacteria bacterium Smac51]|nr:hypothetical protein C4J81_09485 [Deltaproteobacteria bacterium Smac51]
MKTIAVVANHKSYSSYLKANLERYFQPYAAINCYSTKEAELLDYIPGDLVLVSAFTIFQNVKHKIRPDSDMILASITINREGLTPLNELPAGTRALLCNIDYRTCMQVIAELYTAGYRNLELVPYHGEGDYDRTIELAITPDEFHMVPSDMKRVIDIGQRVLDLNCIYDIAGHLGLGEEFASAELVGLRGGQINSGIERVLGEHQSMSERISVLLTLIPQGILVTNVTGRICLSNEKADRLLEKRSDVLAGFALGDVLPELNEFESQTKQDSAKQLIINVEGNNLVVAVTQIVISGEVKGTVITLDNFEERENIQHDIRSRLSKVDHFARYHFDDIVGKSRAIRETMATARRIARSDGSILIAGESGTGKEVFAQSIHNESPRRDYNFVAVNCAAIPENLLESEMFGYEEGSFTGARKGGRAGYFELSHRGTIFLDEIAELPLQLQSKLLRVIEERKIIKIGSQKVVDVDVRIIAATNRDLFELMEKGLFREDLYYRLNVLPLRLPPLRDRSEDVLLLIEHFQKLQKLNFNLSPECAGRLCGDPWRGNIRELRNIVEYLGSLDKPVITEADLPDRVQRPRKPAALARPDQTGFLPGEETPLVKSFLLKEGRRLELFIFILRELSAALDRGERLGRRSLLEASDRNRRGFTEAEIRGALKRLDEYGFVYLGQGRGGSRISRAGEIFLHNFRD